MKKERVHKAMNTFLVNDAKSSVKIVDNFEISEKYYKSVSFMKSLV